MGDDTPGWDAITAALAAVYGTQEPFHCGPVLPAMLGGNDPLNGISIYRSQAGTSHWHFVTYGFSELYAKESDDEKVSGYGLEMTVRLARGADEGEPPGWTINFLQNVARYVFQTGNVFEVGHQMNLNGPIALGSATAIRAILFASDPELAPIETPNGTLQFLQAVGITLEEWEAAQLWNTRAITDVLARKNPLLVTDLRRDSVLADPIVREEVELGSRRDGSSSRGNFVTSPEWAVTTSAGREQLRLTIGALAAKSLVRLLLARLPHGNSFSLWGSKRSVCFEPADHPCWKLGDDLLTIGLPTPLVERMLNDLVPRRGSYRWHEFKDFCLEVVPSEIKDQDDKVTEVVG